MAKGILSGVRPKLADVQCSRMQFQPGDRLLVRVYRKLDKDQKAKLTRTVKRWAGDVEVLVIDSTEMEISVEQSGIKL